MMNLAHRGASEYAPENTLAAFYKAIEQGANGLETDLRMTKEGVIFLIHDDELNRTTNGSGSPSAYTWDELEQLDAGSWFGPKYTGERLVTFEQFLHIYGRRKLYFAIELKDRHLETQVLERVDQYSVRERVTLTSFTFDNLVSIRERDANIKIGYLVPTINKQTIKELLDIDGEQICPAANLLEPADVRLAKESGLEVRAWGVATEELMHHTLSCGVDGMTINFPDKLTQVLGSKDND